MLDREPFLKAIYADPASDLPRLVFADWLDDHGDSWWAELIRVQCALARDSNDRSLATREEELLREPTQPLTSYCRGLPVARAAEVAAATLGESDEFRRVACASHPEWYGATALRVTSGRITDPLQVETLLRSPVTEQVTQLDLSGHEEHLGTGHDDSLGLGLIDFVYRPTITTRMVEHLCGLREARRLVTLDLSRNELDNDAVRALIRSTNLIRLKSLTIQEGNTRVKGRLWGELRQRFGEEAVS